MKKIIHYSKLVVNPENYRFDPVENQDEAIDLMLEEKGLEILNLAKHILDYGLDEAKDFRVLEMTPEIYRVLDGNRRVTAIKCLHDLSLIKDKKLNKAFQNLLETKKIPPTDIQCFVYKEEKLAAQWIKLDHTGKNEGVGQDSWGSAEKDRFAYKFEGKISPAMQAVSVVEKELEKKINTKKLKVSTINRILSNPESRSYLGVNVVGGKLLFTADEKESLTRLDTLFDTVIRDNVTVAKVYHAPQTIEFIKDIFGDKPKDVTKPTLFPQETEEKKSEDEEEISKAKKVATKGSSAKTDWVTCDEYKLYKGADRVKDILNELYKNKPVKGENINILAVSLRVVIELAVYEKLKGKGFIAKIVEAKKAAYKEDGKSLDQKWSPGLKEMLKFMLDDANDIVTDPQDKKAIGKLIGERKDFIDNLDFYIHNVSYTPTETKIREIWKAFCRPIFDIISKIK